MAVAADKPVTRASAADAGPVWHALPSADVIERLDIDPARGLSEAAVAERLQQYGPNRIESAAKTGPLKRFLLQFHNVLIYVLLVAAAGTALLGEWVDTGVIIGVVLINAIIGFIQEGKAEQALDAIRGMLSPKALVLREGERRLIDAAELVPGDIVILQAGDRVPADVRHLEVKNLRIEEAVLTGESVPVEKSVEPVDSQASLGDRSSLAFSGTIVTYGRGRSVVIATGGETEIGRISSMLASVEQLTTPLLRQMGQFGRWLSVGILALALLTFAFGLLVRGYAAAEMFMAAVSLAVAAIPEGLPAIMTITLAIGVQRMARRNAIIRRLPAVETLGSVTIICSDKTGTLTRNEMTVQTVRTADSEFEVGGVGYAPTGGFSLDGGQVDPEHDQPVLAQALRAALLCNDAEVSHKDGEWRMQGDPTEGALVTVALKGGLDAAREREAYPRTDVIPFESEHKFMATLHHNH
jgi:magnesium-transporting ATPase (P-type)